MKRFKAKFERDWNFYIRASEDFNFSGKEDQLFLIESDGVSAKEAFYYKDSQGKNVPTKEPDLLRTVFRAKASINLHIKMWAQDLGKGLLYIQDLWELKKQYDPPSWVFDAVYQQSGKYETDRSRRNDIKEYLHILKGE